MKIDWDLLATLGVAGAIALGAFLVAPRLGLFAYNGLPTSKVYDVYRRFDQKCDVMTRAHGRDWLGQEFQRGIYSCNGPMYYYRLDKDLTGRTSFFIYPLLLEYFTDSPDIGGTTGTVA